MPIPTYEIRIHLQKSRNIRNFQTTHTPSDIFERLPVHKPHTRARANTFSTASTVYRHGPINLDWIDFVEGQFDSVEMRALLNGKEKEERGRVTTSATFVPSPHVSGSTNLPDGIVHIFRAEPTRPSHTPSLSAASEPSASNDPLSRGNTEKWDGVTLGVLSVPSWMTPADFLAFVAPAAEGLKHLRIIRDSLPNRSLAVLKFRSPDDASEFAEAYNGQNFSSTEPETVHVVQLSSIIVSPSAMTEADTLEQDGTEMPTCPVCLERMDASATGLITIPCAHTFHCMCLSKWGDSRCPVCRYSQTMLSSTPGASSSPPAPSEFPTLQSTASSHSTCTSCSSNTNLWICLVCGNLGCGRYGRAHAHQHYETTSHTYALELETQRVWDYAGDGYVHRLIRNKADGKLVELPSAASGATKAEEGDGKGPTKKDALSAEKIETIGMEYSTLLISQLDSQREWYEERSALLHSELSELKVIVGRLEAARLEDQKRLASELAALKAEDAARQEVFTRERTRAEQRGKAATDLARRLERELKEERAVSAGLLQNLSLAKTSATNAESERGKAEERVKEMEEQVRDVMFALEVQNKIGEGGVMGEVEGGSVVVPAPQADSGKKRKGRK